MENKNMFAGQRCNQGRRRNQGQGRGMCRRSAFNVEMMSNESVAMRVDKSTGRGRCFGKNR